MTNSDSVIYTIGHSTHGIERFLGLLSMHQIDAVADVRSVPYSQWQPQFNRENLVVTLRNCGIAYAFMGKELGARSDDKSCYENGQVIYSRLAATMGFQSAVRKLFSQSTRRRIALVCAEAEPLDCHRTLLVSRALVGTGMQVFHIHADGRLESHDDAMLRLLKILRIPERNLIQTSAEIIDEAYAEQEHRIAYVDKDLARAARETHQ